MTAAVARVHHLSAVTAGPLVRTSVLVNSSPLPALTIYIPATGDMGWLSLPRP
jgi:hypothetical protein